MQAITNVTSKTGSETVLARMVLSKQLWNRMKIQAIHEDVSGDQLVARVFEKYLNSPEAERRRQ